MPAKVEEKKPTKVEEKERYNTLRASPAGAKYKLAVVQFKVPGAKNGGSDKGPDGNRVDSIPIANSIIKAGGACDLLLYDATKHEDFVQESGKYDALVVRINPGQLSQGTPEGTQARFDDLMNDYISKGKLIWSSPKIQTQMGAKDALVNIGSLNCGLKDTFAYYTEEELYVGFKKTCAFQPRVLKQNRGSAGEGIWLCWLWDKESNTKIEIYPSKSFGESSLDDDSYLKLMEMNDNHVEYHTVKEFMIFCIEGPTGEGAGEWKSTFPGQYLKGGKAAHGQLVDQRLLPRIDEGEVRILMAGDTCQMAIHKKPMGGGLSAVGGMSDYTYYRPTDKKYQNLIQKLYADIPTLLPSLHLEGEPLPLLWTCDYIPKNPDDWPDGPYARNCPDEKTEYTVGEFNCSCVGISKFQAVCGGEKTLADVPDEDYFDACELTDLMGVKAIEMLEKANKGGKKLAKVEEKKPANQAETVKAEVYELGDKIAEGEWGTVYHGSWRNAAGESEQVAIKKLDKKDKEGKEKQDAKTQLDEMKAECRLNQFAHELSKPSMPSLGCARVPRVHSYTGGEAIMQFVQGTTLEKYIRGPGYDENPKRQRSIENVAFAAHLKSVCHVVVQKVCELLLLGRDSQFSHRDLNDGNVMIDVKDTARDAVVKDPEDIAVWMIDFGKSMALIDGEQVRAEPSPSPRWRRPRMHA
jgi:hypothetical protein